MIGRHEYFVTIIFIIGFSFMSLNGCKKNNPVQTNNTIKKPFTFPLNIGTTWKYHSISSYNGAQSGLHIWKVIDSEGSGNWNCIDIRTDSVAGLLIRNDSIPFVIRNYSDYIKIEFPEWVGLFDSSRIVPKFVEIENDTLTFKETKNGGVTCRIRW
jgi:hypothetical protein